MVIRGKIPGSQSMVRTINVEGKTNRDIYHSIGEEIRKIRPDIKDEDINLFYLNKPIPRTDTNFLPNFYESTHITFTIDSIIHEEKTFTVVGIIPHYGEHEFIIPYTSDMKFKDVVEIIKDELIHMDSDQFSDFDVTIYDAYNLQNPEARVDISIIEKRHLIYHLTPKYNRILYFDSPGWGLHNIKCVEPIISANDIYKTLADILNIDANRLYIMQDASSILDPASMVDVRSYPEKVLYWVYPC